MAVQRGSTGSVKIVVVRTGGIAGTRTEWRLTAQGDDVDELLEAVEAVDWEVAAIDPASRDRFVWRIAVTGRARHRATVPDAQLTGPRRDLVDRVQRHGERVDPARSPGRARSTAGNGSDHDDADAGTGSEQAG